MGACVCAFHKACWCQTALRANAGRVPEQSRRRGRKGEKGKEENQSDSLGKLIVALSGNPLRREWKRKEKKGRQKWERREYTKTTAGVGISAQKYNPEIRLERPDTTVYTLADRLRVVRRLVMKQLSWLPKADSQHSHAATTDESGSGVDMKPESMSLNEYPTNDDEEYSSSKEYYDSYYNDSEGSAEGSGDFGSNSITPVEKNTLGQSVSTTDGGSASHPTTSVCLISTTITAAILLLHY
ncbi:hypothetical protein Pcinc_035331 [Petrolisthes cinctipes]|uniref:Uncharacterized protein n=1 Tax=Petrolisthes cinctipes TaxID=88211 RepID=A0AAE1BWS0_PETCI|nr:hypothetical protein Pcinc_035331 [Petrolisthes cinctipes]